MKKSIFLLLTLALILALIPAGMAKKPAPTLTGTLDYWWVRDTPGQDPPPFPGQWEGTLIGDDINAYAVYPSGAMTFAGQTSHYGGSFEIYADDTLAVLLMAGGGEQGSTTVRHGKNSIWRTSSTVKEAYGDYADWEGRRVHQEGTFTWESPGVPEAGTGTFRVN